MVCSCHYILSYYHRAWLVYSFNIAQLGITVTNCRWLSHVKEALNAACLAAQCLEKEDAPVMVVEQVISWDIVDWGLLEAFGNSIDVVY